MIERDDPQRRARTHVGIELTAGLENVPEPFDSRCHLRRQFPSEECWHHGATAPHEQRVADELSQPGQRVAHGRRRDVQPLSGARDTAFHEHVMQHQDQIQIDGFNTHSE